MDSYSGGLQCARSAGAPGAKGGETLIDATIRGGHRAPLIETPVTYGRYILTGRMRSRVPVNGAPGLRLIRTSQDRISIGDTLQK